MRLVPKILLPGKTYYPNQQAVIPTPGGQEQLHYQQTLDKSLVLLAAATFSIAAGGAAVAATFGDNVRFGH